MWLNLGATWKLGPFRINLTRSGFGFSFGLSGFRIGIAARGGPYVHVGRGLLSKRVYITGRSEPGERD